MRKDQIEILEDALNLLEDYPSILCQRTVSDRYYCAVCNGLAGGENHKENCRLIETQTKLNQLIEELRKND